MDQGFLIGLDILRDRWTQPLYPTSAYRCLKHNKEVGGERDSYHPKGRAIDFGKFMDANVRYAFVKLAMSLGFYGIGIMANAIHLDNRQGRKVLFHYYGKTKT